MAADKLQLQVILSALDKASGPLNRIQGGSRGAGKALQETRDKIKQLNDIQRNITGFKDYQAQLESTGNSLQETRDKMGALERAVESHRTAQQALAGETKVHRAAVRNLQRELLRSKEPNAELSKQYMIAKDNLAKLETKYNASQNTMRRYKEDLGNTATAARTLNGKHQALSQHLAEARTKLDAAGISTDKLAQHEQDLAGGLDKANAAMKVQKDRLAAITKQQESLGRARDQFNKAQQVAGGMATGGAAALGTGYAVSRPIAAAINAFAPAENAATQLKVSMMASDGSVTADFEKITNLATNLGDRLPGTTADFQEMMTMLRRQGMSAQSILGGTGEAAAFLGVQLQMGVTDAAEFAAKMQDATRTSEKDMLGLMDTIQRAYYIGVDSGNMLHGFTKLSPVMGIIKQEGLQAANTLAPLLVMMDQTGMAGESAGNALRKVFQSGLSMDKVSKANKELKSLGISMDFTDGKGEFGGMDKLFAQLEKLKGLTAVRRTSVMKELFGDDAETLQVVNTMMNKGMAGYQEVAAKMQAQADLRMRVNEQLGTLTNVMDAAQGSWTNAMAEFGAVVAPELKELITGLGKIANGVGAWVRENPELAKQIVKTAAGVAMLMIGMGSLSIAMASIIGPFAMLRYGMTLLGIATTASLWPVLAVIAAIAALAAAAYLIYRHWEPIKAFFSQTWGEIVMDTLNFLGRVSKIFLDWNPLGLFYTVFADVLNWFGLDLPRKFSEFGANIMAGLWQGLKDNLPSIANFITNLGAKLPEPIRKALGIHSPSRVFAELGGFTMAGLGQGLAGGEADVLLQVAGTAKRVANAGADMLGLSFDNRAPISASGGRGAARAGDTYNVTINAAPGMDAAAIGREVQRQLAAAQQQQQARSRGRLADQE